MLKKVIPNSLPIRARIAVTTITFIYFLTTVSTGVLAWVAEDDAQAINIAGSVRMATYRINYLLVTGFQEHELRDIAVAEDAIKEKSTSPIMAVADDMQKRLDRLNAYQSRAGGRYKQIDKNINQQLTHINYQWSEQLKPALLTQDSEYFYQYSVGFVQDVDELVTQLQRRNESRQQLQQYIQIASLIISILIMLAGLWELKYKVLLPVNTLKQANERFKKGKLDTRVEVSGYIEFDSLARSFNDMAQTIAGHQNALKQEVALKTASLTQANQVLTLLYDFAQSLTTTEVSVHELNQLLSSFEKIVPQLNFTLCLQSSNLDSKDSIAVHGSRLKEICSSQTCENCKIKKNSTTKSYALKNQDTLLGELRVQPKHNHIAIYAQDVNYTDPKQKSNVPSKQTCIHPLIEQNNDMILALSNLISTALSLKQQRYQDNQIVLLEERATIARELHDSLAQSLSYLKIQLSILEKQLLNVRSDNFKDENLKKSIANIKQGLNSAYQHLRDLLVTFRLSIDDDGFDVALYNSAEEFSTKGNFEITIHNQVMTQNLTASEQVNLIQIIRESLSNINRHSKAKKADISLQYEQDFVILTIKDDGIGIDSDFDQTQHHGLKIMQERAHSLGGKLSVTANTPSGTVISTCFTPAFFKKIT